MILISVLHFGPFGGPYGVANGAELRGVFIDTVTYEFLLGFVAEFYLGMESCNIGLIEEKSFIDMRVLTELNLNHNRLVHITKNMFYGIRSNLQVLLLMGNSIRTVEAGAFSMKHLDVLDLTDNNLMSFPAELFLDTIRLRTLLLASHKQQMQMVTPFALPMSIEILEFVPHQIINLEQFRQFRNLRILRLKYCDSTAIIEPAASMQSITELELLPMFGFISKETVLRMLPRYPNIHSVKFTLDTNGIMELRKYNIEVRMDKLGTTVKHTLVSQIPVHGHSHHHHHDHRN